jgi:ankyrin repeat protein
MAWLVAALASAGLASCAATQFTAADQRLLDALKAKDAAQVEAALAQGAQPNIEYADHMRPLSVAVARNDHASAASLLRAGADPNTSVDLGSAASGKASLLSLAEDNEMVQILIKGGADANRVDAASETPLGRAVLNGDAAVVQALADAGANVDTPLTSGQTPLRFAVSTGNVAVVEALLKGGADPNREDSTGATALHEAAASPNAGVTVALLKGKANINQRSPNGTTALMVAASEGYVGPLRILLENGADANIKNEIGMTALDLANAKGQTQIAGLLKDAGAEAALDVEEARTKLRAASGSDALRVFTTDLTTDGRYIKIRGRIENPFSETVHGVRYRVSLYLPDSTRQLDAFIEERNDTEIAPGDSAALRMDVASMYAGGRFTFYVEAVPMRLGEREIPEPPQWSRR